MDSEDRVSLQALSGLVSFLKSKMIDDITFELAEFVEFDFYSLVQSTSNLVLDPIAIQSLSLTEACFGGKDYRKQGSLYDYLDKTVTPFGRRMLKRWICNPLADVKKINQRLDAIEELNIIANLRTGLQAQMKQLPDLECACSKMYSWSLKNKNNITFFENLAVQRLKELKKILNEFMIAADIVDQAREFKIQSELLLQLTSTIDVKFQQSQQSDFSRTPRVRKIVNEIRELITWDGVEYDIPTPRQGVDPEYDKNKNEIEEILADLDEYLKSIRQRFGNSPDIQFEHVRHRYEIEFPSDLFQMEEKPAEFEFSSKKAGRERFITSRIKELVGRLEKAEDNVKECLNNFATFIFSLFYKHRHIWDRFVESMAHLDCLCSLSLVSFNNDHLGSSCRPEVVQRKIDEEPFIEIYQGRNPILQQIISNFIPNDTFMATKRLARNGLLETRPNLLLLTGPNMAGKSTYLRQVCLLVLLAQIGCYVPAKSCRFSVVDKIFARMGSSDQLILNKSTFFMEMEETKTILKHATLDSLIIFDELGRGTSTFDGTSIAYGCIKYIFENLNCRTLFSTHYHILLTFLQEYANKIQYYYMDFEQIEQNPEINSLEDYQKQESQLLESQMSEKPNKSIEFLFKLQEGASLKSFGLNVAQMVGIPENVIESANQIIDEIGGSHIIAVKKFAKLDQCALVLKDIEQGVSHSLVSDQEIDQYLQELSKVVS